MQPLPALSRIAGLVLPGGCFSDCLMVMQFLRCFGKVLGFDLSADMPSLGALQAGLLNVGDSMGFIQDLLVRMLSAAVCDPGLPPGHRVRGERLYCMLRCVWISALFEFTCLPHKCNFKHLSRSL